MKLEEAKREAAWIVSKLDYLSERVLVVGSIRRERPEVNDIDIVVIPKASRDRFWDDMSRRLQRCQGMVRLGKGPKLMRFARYRDAAGLVSSDRQPDYTVDVYHATPDTWGILVLIRTGSKMHNVKLCSLARSKGLMLSASQGLIKYLKAVEPFEPVVKIIASRSEEEIFAGLGLDYVEPRDREVPA